MAPGSWVRLVPTSPTLLCSLALLAALVLASPLRAQVTSRFDSNLEGWLIVGDNSATWSAMGASDTLAVDVCFANTSGGGLLTGAWLLRIAGPGGAAIAIARPAGRCRRCAVRPRVTYQRARVPRVSMCTKGPCTEVPA
jgi:hypothetical protein